MYERMTDKQNQPTCVGFAEYCGQTRTLYERLDAYLRDELKTERLLRFPYGSKYGWGMKYSVKNKLICDVFAEKDAFTVMLRMTNAQFESEYGVLTDYTKKYIDSKYPCGEGGWIHFRLLTEEHLDDIERLLRRKVCGKQAAGDAKTR